MKTKEEFAKKLFHEFLVQFKERFYKPNRLYLPKLKLNIVVPQENYANSPTSFLKITG